MTLGSRGYELYEARARSVNVTSALLGLVYVGQVVHAALFRSASAKPTRTAQGRLEYSLDLARGNDGTSTYGASVRWRF